MNKQAVHLVASCPECHAQIRFRKQPELGDLVTCPECSMVGIVMNRIMSDLNAPVSMMTTTIFRHRRYHLSPKSASASRCAFLLAILGSAS